MYTDSKKIFCPVASFDRQNCHLNIKSVYNLLKVRVIPEKKLYPFIPNDNNILKISEVLCHRCFFGRSSVATATGQKHSWCWSVTPMGKDDWCKCTSLHLGGHNVDGSDSTQNNNLLIEIQNFYQQLSKCNEKGRCLKDSLAVQKAQHKRLNHL